jgi:hypothetical protein
MDKAKEGQNSPLDSNDAVDSSEKLAKPHPVPDTDFVPTVGSNTTNLYFSEELALALGRDVGERWFALQQSHLRYLHRRRSVQSQNQVRWIQMSSTL